MKYSLKHILEYVLVRLAAALLRRLPYRAALFLGWCAAGIGFYIVRYRVREAQGRIREVFGARFSKGEIRRIAWISWRNFIFTVVEAIRLPVSSRAWALKAVKINPLIVRMQEWVRSGRGGIIATAHMGAWELAALACLVHDIPLFSLAAAQKNKLVDEFYNRARAGTGFETVLRSASVLKTILRKIKTGRMLAILSDVRGKTDALPVKFLGKTANVAEGMGFIAHQADAPVFPVMISRIGWGEHHCRIYEPIFPDPHAEKRTDALRITQAVFDILTACVRNEPEQWFWFNKRWIFDPLAKTENKRQSPEA
ncbi:MAG: lysophospholipid acyltransferase family protein [Kiritimatiellae bacterium]|nr:lysophospholipid acyltransferase family protein [Kiritimatiellia bacterium]